MIADILQIILSASVTTLASGLLIISLLSFRKFRNNKLLLISLVFVLFLIRGVLMSIGVFWEEFFALYITTFHLGILDVLMLLVLFIATLKK